MRMRRLGGVGLEVSAIGLGCVNLVAFYGPAPNEATAISVIDRALELGVSFLDTADSYGPFVSEQLVGKAIAGRRERVVVGTKFGHVRAESGEWLGVNGRPDYVQMACEASLSRLCTDYIDVYHQHVPDPDVPVEETIGAMAALVTEGKVRYLGLSKTNADRVRRANAVHPISVVQNEYSLSSRDVEESVLQTCRELDIGLTCYSPLGRGMLTGKVRAAGAMDYRNSLPGFQGKNLDHNLRLVDRLSDMASDKGVSAAQLALAWLLHRGDDIVPIPGTKSVARVEENAAAAEISLTESDMAILDKSFPPGAFAGASTPGSGNSH